MGLFSKKPRICPICSTQVDGGENEAIGHTLTHLDDVRGDPNGALQLACGCPDAIYQPMTNYGFGRDAKDHLVRVHGMKA